MDLVKIGKYIASKRKSLGMERIILLMIRINLC